MGADIHVTLGRITQRALTDQTQKQNAPNGYALALFNTSVVQYGDISMEKFDDEEEELDRDYGLFSFLAGVRGSIKPLVDVELLQKQTRQFVDWLYQEKVKELSASGKEDSWSLARYHKSDFRYEIGVDDHSWVFYPVAVLWNFDYDQTVMIEDPESDITKPVYILSPKNESYRDRFTDSWFNFLNKLKREEWDFVIFSFDN